MQEQKQKKEKIEVNVSREFSRFDDRESNRLILQYLAMDQIITEISERKLNIALKLKHFNSWLNAFLSGNWDFEFNAEMTEVVCSYQPLDLSEYNEHLVNLFEMISGNTIDIETIELEMINIGIIVNSEPDTTAEKIGINEMQYINSIHKINVVLIVLHIIMSFLKEDFDECLELWKEEEFFYKDVEEYSLIIHLINIYLDLFQGKAGEALDLIEEFSNEVEEDEYNTELKPGIYLLTLRYLNSKDKQGLKRILRDKTFPESEKFLLLFTLYQHSHFEDEYKDKISYLNMARKYAGKEIPLNAILINQYIKMEMPKVALHIASGLENSNPENQALQFLKSKALISIGHFQEALGLLDGILADGNEDNTDMLVEKGICLVEFGRIDEGKACWFRALEIEPDFTEALLNLAAFNYFEAKDMRQALHYFLAAEKTGALHYAYYEVIAEIYEKLGLMMKKHEYLLKAERAEDM